MLATMYSGWFYPTRYYSGPAANRYMIQYPPLVNNFANGGFFGAGTHSLPAARGPRLESSLVYQIAPTNDLDPNTGCGGQFAVYDHSFDFGGLSTALCDASVKIISPTMSPTTFGRALAPCDQQPLGADWTQE
jgi:hypothetical protein